MCSCEDCHVWSGTDSLVVPAPDPSWATSNREMSMLAFSVDRDFTGLKFATHSVKVRAWSAARTCKHLSLKW